MSGEEATPVDPLVRATGVEVGVRSEALSGLHTTLSLFELRLDSELVFVGDGGTTEAGRPSRRRGIEWTNVWRARPWLSLELDLALTHARFTDRDPSGDHIPGALERVVAAAVVLERGAWQSSLRWRAFSGYPLIEDHSVRAGATSLVNARLGYRFERGLVLSADVFNLLDRDDNDVAYYYASRLPGEPLAGVQDVHFHPVERRSVRLQVGYRF